MHSAFSSRMSAYHHEANVNAVKRYLVSKGIGADRIDTVGYGPSRPINTNRSLKERPENRRVEMVVITV